MSNRLLNAAFKTQLPNREKFVLVALCDQADDEGMCFPSVPLLAARCSMSLRSVQGALRALEALGVLKRDFRQGRSTVYRIVSGLLVHAPAGSADTQPLPPAEAAPEPRKPCALPAQDLHHSPADLAQAPAAVAPITLTQPSPEPSVNHQHAADAGDKARPDTLFDQFWQVWPNKAGRKAALKAWQRIRPDAALLARMLAALAQAVSSPQWTQAGGRYIPLPATWLNGARWEDEPQGSQTAHGSPHGNKPAHIKHSHLGLLGQDFLGGTRNGKL